MPTPTTLASRTCIAITPRDERGEFILARIIRRVCHKIGFRTREMVSAISQDISRGNANLLTIAPLAIAYYRPDSSRNTLIHIGYRLATRLPLIILCDEGNVESLQREFCEIGRDLVISIPSGVEIDNIERTHLLNRLRRRVKRQLQAVHEFRSNQAVTVLQAPADSVVPDQSYYVAVSKRASELFPGPHGLIGRTLAQFIEDLRDKMPDYQFRAFEREQASLVRCADPSAPVVIARVPIVFSEGNFRGRAFLPIVVNHQVVGLIQEFRIMFLDVTSTTIRVEDPVNKHEYFISQLDPNHEPLELNDEEVPNRVFLAYNSDNSDSAHKVNRFLTQMGCRTWFDEDRVFCGSILERVEEGVQESRVALFFIGASGLGPFQGAIEYPMLVERMRTNGIEVIPVLLDGLRDLPDTFVYLNALRHVTIEEVMTKEWVTRLKREYLFR